MLRKLSLTLTLILMVCAPALARNAQAADPASTAQPLASLVGPDHAPRQAVLSPDGKLIAWIDGDELCLYAVDAESTTCTPRPPELRSVVTPVVWSPDSASLAFSEDFFRTLYDPDIHIFDVKTGTFRDLTDDQTDESLLKIDDDTPQDYLPTWNPVTGTLYFWRSYRGDDVTSLSLYRFTSLDSEPQEVQNLTRIVPQPYAVFRQPAISPDGRTMAFLVLPQHLTQPASGLWTIDVDTGATRLVANLFALRAGTPDWVDAPDSFPESVGWAGDRIVVAMRSIDPASLRPGNVVVVSPADKSITPIFDLGVYPTQKDYANARAGGQIGRGAIPTDGIVMPDGEHYLYTHHISGGELSFATIALPPSDAAPVELASSSAAPGSSAPVNSISADGSRALVMGYLLELDPAVIHAEAIVERVTTLTGESSAPRVASLSPDSNKFAWVGNEGLCILTLDDQSRTCHPFPADYSNTAPALEWSPGSDQIAFTENFHVNNLEPDVHLFNLYTGEFSTVTGDGVDGRIDPEHSETPLDFLPAWDSWRGDLFYWSSYWHFWTPTLWRYTPSTRMIQMMAQITPDDGGDYTIYRQPVITPDARTMAVILQKVGSGLSSSLYTVDLTSGDVRRLATLDQLRAGTPDWVDSSDAIPRSLGWAGDRVLVEMVSASGNLLMPANVVLVSLADGAVTPVFDYDVFADRLAFAQAESDGTLLIPRGGAVSPDGRRYVYLHSTGSGTFGIAVVDLADGSPLREIVTRGESPLPLALLSEYSADGRRTVIGGNLLTFLDVAPPT